MIAGAVTVAAIRVMQMKPQSTFSTPAADRRVGGRVSAAGLAPRRHDDPRKVQGLSRRGRHRQRSLGPKSRLRDGCGAPLVSLITLPVLAREMSVRRSDWLLTRRDIDGRLVGGRGAVWRRLGFVRLPSGPAAASAADCGPDVACFIGAKWQGMLLARWRQTCAADSQGSGCMMPHQ